MVELLKTDRIAEAVLMSYDATPSYQFSTWADRPLEATFDGGVLTTDGGVPWLIEADRQLGICAAFAASLKDWRKAPSNIRHSL